MVSLERVRQIDELCVQFEQSWKEGRRVPIEEFVKKLVLPDEKAQLICELVATEVELRKDDGEEVTLRDYEARFPGLALGVQEQTSAPPEIDGYELESEIGRGGTSVVYKARQLAAQRTVALKLILHGVDDQSRKRFISEAKIIARLRHPGIIRVYQAGLQANQPFLVLEHVDDGGLDRYLKDGPIHPQAAAAFLEKVARAVHHAHTQGVIHRDLKPANLLVKTTGEASDNETTTSKTNGASKQEGEADWRVLGGPLATAQPKVTDFGISKLSDLSVSITKTGTIMGTPSYMSPEQVSGRRDIGPASDIFTLGVVLYEMLCGRSPFLGTDLVHSLRLVSESDAKPLRQMRPSLPRDLETICFKCLHKQPERRYASAEALADDLQAFLDGRPIVARCSKIDRVARHVQQRVFAVVLMACVLVSAVALFARWRDVPDQPPSGLEVVSNRTPAAPQDDATPETGDASEFYRGVPIVTASRILNRIKKISEDFKPILTTRNETSEEVVLLGVVRYGKGKVIACADEELPYVPPLLGRHLEWLEVTSKNTIWTNDETRAETFALLLAAQGLQIPVQVWKDTWAEAKVQPGDLINIIPYTNELSYEDATAIVERVRGGSHLIIEYSALNLNQNAGESNLKLTLSPMNRLAESLGFRFPPSGCARNKLDSEVAVRSEASGEIVGRSAYEFRRRDEVPEAGIPTAVQLLSSLPPEFFSRVRASDRPLRVFVFAGQSNADGWGSVNTLAYSIRHSDKPELRRLLTAGHRWLVREDVWVRLKDPSHVAKLTVGLGSDPLYIGPELGFGLAVGDALDEPVLLVKWHYGPGELATNLRPPSSEGEVGAAYLELRDHVQRMLTELQDRSTADEGFQFEFSGLIWWQGWNDMTNRRHTEYETHLANLIRDLRADWRQPDLPIVIAEFGQHGPMTGLAWEMKAAEVIRQAQRTVADRDEFKRTVRFVPTANLIREWPRGKSHLYWNNGETFYNVGLRMGAAMLELIKKE